MVFALPLDFSTPVSRTASTRTSDTEAGGGFLSMFTLLQHDSASAGDNDAVATEGDGDAARTDPRDGKTPQDAAEPANPGATEVDQSIADLLAVAETPQRAANPSVSSSQSTSGHGAGLQTLASLPGQVADGVAQTGVEGPAARGDGLAAAPAGGGDVHGAPMESALVAKGIAARHPTDQGASLRNALWLGRLSLEATGTRGPNGGDSPGSLQPAGLPPLDQSMRAIGAVSAAAHMTDDRMAAAAMPTGARDGPAKSEVLAHAVAPALMAAGEKMGKTASSDADDLRRGAAADRTESLATRFATAPPSALSGQATSLPLTGPQPPGTSQMEAALASLSATQTPMHVDTALQFSGIVADPALDVGSQTTAPRNAPVIQAIAQQIAPYVPNTGTRGFELTLAPEELGAIRMRLTGSESHSTLIIQVERPETMTLMRQHIAMLEQELCGLGHENLSVRFAGQEGGEHADRDQPHSGFRAQTRTSEASGQGETGAPALNATGATAVTQTHNDHLDLRL